MDETNANSFVNRELHSKAFICNSKVIVFDKNNSGIRHFKPSPSIKPLTLFTLIARVFITGT